MTRQFDIKSEEKIASRQAALVRAVEFELIGSLSHGGAALNGFSVKLRGYDCLLVLRAHVDDMNQVAFVSADDLGGCLIKAVRMALNDGLRWKEDAYPT